MDGQENVKQKMKDYRKKVRELIYDASFRCFSSMQQENTKFTKAPRKSKSFLYTALLLSTELFQ